MRWVAAIVVIGVLGACASGVPTASEPSPSDAASPPIAEIPALDPIFEFPTGPLPDRAGPFAQELAQLQPKLQRAISRWLEQGGNARSRVGVAIATAALRRQRMFRMLSGDRALERRVVGLIPRWIARIVGRHTHASRGLSTLVRPVSGPIHLPTKQPDPVHRLRRFYRVAERRFRIDWELLAAINLIETRFGRLKGPSTSGAQGPMQFMPATWAAYGHGDVRNPYNAIMGAARYLRANGAPRNLRGAVYAYNHADAYVDAVLTYFREMKRDPRNYYSYYFWQVFVKAVGGDIQLTGPGGRRAWIR
jgi:transglycosylase-like protein with SLT domain